MYYSRVNDPFASKLAFLPHFFLALHSLDSLSASSAVLSKSSGGGRRKARAHSEYANGFCSIALSQIAAAAAIAAADALMLASTPPSAMPSTRRTCAISRLGCAMAIQ